MSERERSGFDSAWTRDERDDRRRDDGASDREERYPPDFSDDEAIFSDKMRALFPLEDEAPPPLYAETLLGATRHAPPESSFEHRLIHRVRRRLELPGAKLFAGEPSESWRSRVATLARAARPHEMVDSVSRLGRPLVGALTVLGALILVTTLLSAPAFAAGLRILVGQTGVVQVHSYPAHVSVARNQPSAAPDPRVTNPSMLDASGKLYWLGESAGGYIYQGTRLLPREQWSKGRIVDIQYTLPGAAKGSGLLDLREFEVADAYSAVLQVVQDGSAQGTRLEGGQVNGVNAVYVDGGWLRRGDSFVWLSGQRSQLIFARDGVVFWLTADQRDGMSQQALLAVARQVTQADPRDLAPDVSALRTMGSDAAGTFRVIPGKELYALVPKGVSPASDNLLFVQQTPPPGAGASARPG